MDTFENEYICRVCGFEYDIPTWEEGVACGDICDCCGVEFGYEDRILIAIMNFRKKWVGNNAKFNSPKYKPPNWSLCEQIKKIPTKWLESNELEIFDDLCKK